MLHVDAYFLLIHNDLEIVGVFPKNLGELQGKFPKKIV